MPKRTVQSQQQSQQDVGSSCQEVEVDEAPPGSVVVDDNRKNAVQKYVDFICPLSELSLLVHTVTTGERSVVRELLVLGADMNYEWIRKGGPGDKTIHEASALLLALGGNGDKVTLLKMLLVAGAEITRCVCVCVCVCVEGTDTISFIKDTPFDLFLIPELVGGATVSPC